MNMKSKTKLKHESLKLDLIIKKNLKRLSNKEKTNDSGSTKRYWMILFTKNFYLLTNNIMTYTTTCECCWHKVTAYTHRLNKNLLDGFTKLVEFYKEHNRSCSLSELDLNNNQYSNFQKLQYFWIARRDENWRTPSVFWNQFFLWISPCRDVVATMWKELEIWIDHKFRQEKNKKPKILMYSDFCDIHWYKKREEYQVEKWHSTQTLFQ